MDKKLYEIKLKCKYCNKELIISYIDAKDMYYKLKDSDWKTEDDIVCPDCFEIHEQTVRNMLKEALNNGFLDDYIDSEDINRIKIQLNCEVNNAKNF